MEKIEKGMWIVSPSGQPFKVVREEEKKLWSGSKSATPCIVVVGFVDSRAQEVVIQKKDIEQYTNITDDISAIMESFKDIAGEEDGAIIQVEKENRMLHIDLNKALDQIKTFEVALTAAHESIEDKQAIIDEFDGSAADIRKKVHSRSQSIREKYYNRGKKDVEE